MAHTVDLAQVRAELVQAIKEGDEARGRALVSLTGVGKRQVRTMLEAMLEDSDALVRQAAAFGLGELGGSASVERLERQLAIEEERGDYDGEAVVDDITRALGRIEEVGSRASLVRRLERLVAGKPELSDVNALARALWRRRHPELLPVVRRSLERLSLPAPHGLHGLLLLLEKSPDELDAWARDESVPVGFKTRVLAVLEEDVPDTLAPMLPAFMAAAQALSEQSMRQDSAAAGFTERLFSVLLSNRERFLSLLPEETREMLRSVARKLIAATYPNPSLRAAAVLEFSGRLEDAAFIEAHRPADPICAEVFDDAAQALRSVRKH